MDGWRMIWRLKDNWKEAGRDNLENFDMWIKILCPHNHSATMRPVGREGQITIMKISRVQLRAEFPLKKLHLMVMVALEHLGLT